MLKYVASYGSKCMSEQSYQLPQRLRISPVLSQANPFREPVFSNLIQMSERPPPYQPLVEGEYDWNSSESPPQPHQVHPPQQSAAANDTVVSQGLHWTPSTAKFGADPLSNFECPHCQIVVTTRTREVVAWNSYLCLILGCILCGVLALPLLCMLNYSDVEHYCPACGESVGTYVQE